jgi:NAD+ synthetase
MTEIMDRLSVDIDAIRRYSRTEGVELTDWFADRFELQCRNGGWATAFEIERTRDDIIQRLVDYREQYKVEDVVIGISGGLDSALTMRLFEAAGWKVHPVMLPINQQPAEVERAHSMAKDTGALFFDMTDLYNGFLEAYDGVPETSITEEGNLDERIRRGNIRARLRMTVLYDLARMHGGLVASTDNFSELSAGFWTLHGDVGDVAPIQSLNKSWEIPYMADLMGVPHDIIFATPTDGLGTTPGDEDQLGCSYLEWDIVLNEMLVQPHQSLGPDALSMDAVNGVLRRVKKTRVKRNNPNNFEHPTRHRLARLNELDKGFETLSRYQR